MLCGRRRPSLSGCCGLRSGLGSEPGPEGAAFGLQFCVDQCRDLLKGGAPGVHLYTMNKAETAAKVWAAIK